ncbi:MAG: PH domain-containing protein [Hamadaea sp.]|nr:PH domain-containing protein [Hamadaea sp.]
MPVGDDLPIFDLDEPFPDDRPEFEPIPRARPGFDGPTFSARPLFDGPTFSARPVFDEPVVEPMRPALPLPPGRRRALIVATSRYESSEYEDLTAPGIDAGTMTRLLTDPDVCAFEVEQVVDRPWAEIQLAISRLFTDAAADDLVLVYVSGHGEKDHNGRLRLLAVDTDPQNLVGTSVGGRWLLDQAEASDATRQILIVDTCFSGAVDAKGAALADLLAHDLSEAQLPAAGRVLLTACRAAEYAYQHRAPSRAVIGSVFTTALADGISSGHADVNGTGYVTVQDAYRYAYAVVTQAKRRQTPQLDIRGGEGSDIIVARNPAGIRPPAHDLRDIFVKLDSSSLSLRIAAVEELGVLLLDPNPARSTAARNRLDRLVAEDEVLGPLARIALDRDTGTTRPEYRAGPPPRPRRAPVSDERTSTADGPARPDEYEDAEDPIPELFDLSAEELASLGQVDDPLGVFGRRRVLPLEDEPSPLVVRYLFPTEHYRGEWRRHWWDPLLAAAVSGLAVGRAQRPFDLELLRLPSEIYGVATGKILMWTLLAVGALAAHRALSWPMRLLVLTNRRVMTVRGLLWRRVSAISLGDVTDIRFAQTPLGRVLNYGRLSFETGRLRVRSAHHVPNPNELYLRFVEERFEPNAVEARLGSAYDEQDY